MQRDDPTGAGAAPVIHSLRALGIGDDDVARVGLELATLLRNHGSSTAAMQDSSAAPWHGMAWLCLGHSADVQTIRSVRLSETDTPSLVAFRLERTIRCAIYSVAYIAA